MSEIIETLDKKVHIYSLAFSQGFHIEIIGKERKKISLGWCKYRNELQKLWTNHIEEEKMYFQGCKINIKGLLQMTEQFLGQKTMYSSSAIEIASNKEALFDYLNPSRNVINVGDNKKYFNEILKEAKETLYGNK